MLVAIALAVWLKQIPDRPAIVGTPLIMAGVVIGNLFFGTDARKVCGARHAHVWRGVSAR